jgi:hypothetical protein
MNKIKQIIPVNKKLDFYDYAESYNPLLFNYLKGDNALKLQELPEKLCQATQTYTYYCHLSNPDLDRSAVKCECVSGVCNVDLPTENTFINDVTKNVVIKARLYRLDIILNCELGIMTNFIGEHNYLKNRPQRQIRVSGVNAKTSSRYDYNQNTNKLINQCIVFPEKCFKNDIKDNCFDRTGEYLHKTLRIEDRTLEVSMTEILRKIYKESGDVALSKLADKVLFNNGVHPRDLSSIKYELMNLIIDDKYKRLYNITIYEPEKIEEEVKKEEKKEEENSLRYLDTSEITLDKVFDYDSLDLNNIVAGASKNKMPSQFNLEYIFNSTVIEMNDEIKASSFFLVKSFLTFIILFFTLF